MMQQLVCFMTEAHAERQTVFTQTIPRVAFLEMLFFFHTIFCKRF